jgi:hypothetical protein
MDIDLKGRVNINTNLPFSRCLLPLMEAIVNSLHAIEEAGEKSGRIDVFVERDTTQKALPGEEHAVTYPVTGFRVKDNGVGFNDSNFISFKTSDSMYKQMRGGKGVGRLMWLKAFDKAEIDSVFKGNGGTMRRQFTFSLPDDGVGGIVTQEAKGSKRQTTVRLVDFKPEYRQHCPKAAVTIARHIIEHCLEWFIQKNCPSIWLNDKCEDTSIELNRLFKKEMQLGSSTNKFQVKGQRAKKS